LCLTILALYEWWRWLFSIPANPFLLTVVAMVALVHTRRRRRSYKTELARLKIGRGDDGMVGLLIELLRETGRRMCHGIRSTGSQWIPSFTSIQKCSMTTLLSRLRLHVYSTIR
jgi:hypothetical protein